jgi:hypothetical protein
VVISNVELELDKYGYVKNDLTVSTKEFYLKSTKVHVKNKKRYRSSNFTYRGVIGFDTETYLGKCKLICRSAGQKQSLRDPTFLEILDFMYYGARESKYYRFFYNLGFDVSAILKVWGNVEQIILLKNGHTVEYEGYLITYLTNKLFSIRKDKKRVVFTDLWQFYKSKLENAGQKFLGMGKLDNVDTPRLNTDLEYWNKNYDEIEKYCIQDCYVLRDLGIALLKAVNQSGISLPRFICSNASFAKTHFMKYCYIPAITNFPKVILEIAHTTYYGGRFEVLKLGFFRYLVVHDINSQYPTKTRDLPSFKYGKWSPTKIIDLEETYGFYYVRVKIPRGYLLPTLPVRHKGTIKFPVGYFEGWFTWYDLDLVREFVLEVETGIEYKPSKREYYPFRAEIDKLFERKAEFKAIIKELEESKKKNTVEWRFMKIVYSVVKKTLTSLYGTFAETNTDTEGKEYGGRLFNPILATFITAFGRWSVVKDIKKEDYPNIIGIHTDSVIFDKPIDYLDSGVEIGQWNQEAEGKGVILGTGQYQINEKVARRTYAKKNVPSWYTMIAQHMDDSEIETDQSNMMKMAQALHRDKNLERVNLMIDEIKKIRLNADVKREWDYQYSSFGQLLSTIANSKPLNCIKKDENVIILKKSSVA